MGKIVDVLENNTFFKLLLFLTIALSGIVAFEPAPYDVLFLGFIFIACMKHFITYHTVHFWPIICLLFFILTNVVSIFFAHNFLISAYYVVITIYCIISWLFLTSIGTFFGSSFIKTIFYAYVLACLVIVIPGLIAYLYPFEILDIFLWEGRMKGLFKDPNVFGPFLIPATLFSLWRIGKHRQTYGITLYWSLIFMILATGILLSFSRAAWGHFLLSLCIYFICINDHITKRSQTIFIIIILFVPVMFYLIMSTDIAELFFTRLSLQHYDETRFTKQADSLSFILKYPLGFGPGQSEYYLNHSTHNLFIRLISENGLFGAICFIIFLLMTIFRSLWMVRVSTLTMKGIYVIIIASLIGMFFNSFFIDTIHWRHFWLLLALPWIALNDKSR